MKWGGGSSPSAWWRSAAEGTENKDTVAML